MHTTKTDLHTDVIKWSLLEGHYLSLGELLELMPDYKDVFRVFLTDHWERVSTAKGSSHNHQAWEGGYIDHVVETLNIAGRLYVAFAGGRLFPFSLQDALVVMFLHDLEKPWKYIEEPTPTLGDPADGCVGAPEPPAEYKNWKYVDTSLTGRDLSSKQGRKAFRGGLIQQYGISLTGEQENALKYVEGVPDSEYTPGERTMGELAAFCHCCDIMSARLWHYKGQDQEW